MDTTKLILELSKIEIEEVAHDEKFQNAYDLKIDSTELKYNLNSVKKNSDAGGAAKRKLSTLQKAYKDFFLAMLTEYKVDSPAKLTKEQKSTFFTNIKEGWKVKKAELLKVSVVKRPTSKKEQYTKVKVSRPSISIQPIAKTKQKSKPKSENEKEKLFSKKNPEQTDDLKINFHPNQFFEQDEVYEYPVVKMPQEDSYLKLPRNGRAMSKGYKEQNFYEAILADIPEIEVANNLHMAIPFYNKPYEPDIVLIDRTLSLFIDIEIDEPYDGYFRFPTHEFIKDDSTGIIVKKDETRDLFFTESGWVVIKFTERQVHLQESECIALIKDVLNSIRNYKLEQSSNCRSESQWSYQQAIKWQKSNYREKYLGIEKFEKQNTSFEIVVDVDDSEGIEENLYRTKKHKTVALQENISFEDETHEYHHSKDATGNANYISVTTLIDRFFPFDMDRFIENKAKREGRAEEDVLDEFLKNRDEAAEKGTFMHLQIENFLKGEAYDANSKEFKLFKKFYEEIIITKGFEFVEAEKRVLLDEYNVAGTVDALFKKPNKEEYLIVDWKRSKKLVVDGYPKKYGYGNASSELSHLDNSSYYKYALQQNIYKHILENEYDMPISSMNLIVLHEKYNEYHRVNLVNMNKEVAIILNSINHKI